MTTNTVHYFGYGSLVNRATRPADETAMDATLHGWRRAWNHRVVPSPERAGCTALSIDPLEARSGTGGGASAPSIDGVIVALPADALAALDAREANYERLALPREAFSLPASVRVDTVFVYRTRAARRLGADAAHPLLRSYVDCVMAGYLQRFGPAGLDAWLATTSGWEAPLDDDRAAPRYPRARCLPPALLERFDALLAPYRPKVR